MKRYIQKKSRDDATISRPLDFVLEALDNISQTWPCAKQVQVVITSAMEAPNPEEDRTISPDGFDFMAGLSDGANYNPSNIDMGFEMNGDDLGLFDLNNFPDDGFQWDEEIFSG